MSHPFADRTTAGRRLAIALDAYRNVPDGIVLGLPRGGVPVAYEVACSLHLPLDVLVVRKLGVPGQKELAMGAIAAGGGDVYNRSLIDSLELTEDEVQAVVRDERAELQRRETHYRQGRAPLELSGRTVFLIDDGLATGATMAAALNSVRRHDSAQVIIAVPVASQQTWRGFQSLVTEIVCLQTPEDFRSVGEWYDDFGQTSDETVRALLQQAAENIPM